MHRRRLSRSRMRGTFLHNWLGDRILHKGLWSPTRDSLARAWLVGWPITVIPLLPGQSLFAALAALLVRGNLLLCVGLQFLSTPATAWFHLPACYFVGEVVRGQDPRAVWHAAWSSPGNLWSGHAAVSLYVGAVVVGIIGGALGYAIILGTWRERPRRPRRPVEPDVPAETGADVPANLTDPAQLKLPLRVKKSPPPDKRRAE